MTNNHLPSRERLAQLIDYEPSTGLFTYKKCSEQSRRWNSVCAGKPALNYDNGNGYRYGVIDGVKIYAHRAAWIFMTGDVPKQIDHINGDRLDNRIRNLRNVSRSENARNTKRNKANSSGVTGVHWYKSYQKWYVYIGSKPRHHLGYFSCWAQAVAARKKAEKEYAYHPNHGRSVGLHKTFSHN